MEDKELKLIQMDILFDVKLCIKRKIDFKKLNKSVKSIAKNELLIEIKRAQSEYKRALIRYKKGKLDKNTLFDHEWYLYELRQDLESLDGQRPENYE